MVTHKLTIVGDAKLDRRFSSIMPLQHRTIFCSGLFEFFDPYIGTVDELTKCNLPIIYSITHFHRQLA